MHPVRSRAREFQAAFRTRPCLMQVVHTRMRTVRPFLSTRTLLRLGSHRLRVLLCA
jgi:hypothetical protein